jgi:predicted secreted protein
MVTAAVHARGTKIAYEAGSPAAFTDVAEVLDITAPTPNRPEIEVTNHDSPSLTKEFIADDIDPGTMDFEMNFIDNASQDAVQAFFDAGETRTWRITFTNGRVWTFLAYVQAFSATAPAVGSQLRASCTLRLAGTITRTTS